MGIKQNIQFWKYPRLIQENQSLLQERDLLQCQRDSLNEQKEYLLQEKDKLIQEIEKLTQENANLIEEKKIIFDKLSYLNLNLPDFSHISDSLLDIKTITNKARQFQIDLNNKKEELKTEKFDWYPYNTLTNFVTLEKLLTGENRFLLELIGDKPVIDIGCADGDTAFFLESIGCEVKVIDFAPTNFNKLQGVRLLKSALSSSVEIEELNLDEQFILPEKAYSLVFFLGTLYHLKNPFYALNTLAKSAKYCLISTRIAKFNNAHGGSSDRTNISSIPMAYLLDDLEANNDSTNYWIFSDAGLRRILKRAGWEIRDYIKVGNTEDSDPASLEGDERAFCLVKSLLW
ncbi:MAG: hypothetical protein N5P05_003323 [Chroococcopsis gigantea SAG 12.99]|jgi:tRNA (mo5U34)-methyltransferase|nr:methyltransferase domain-containing protein [Chlorogloea purpurea SAG 13.99]MDV3001717.1 hypothetical protein [Chroococcopsis gigantea SAG 12.99]